MSRLFLSHSSHDKKFVRVLATDLRKLGHTVWLDEYSISVGESIVRKVGGGIEQADFVIVVLSRKSVSSDWVEREWQEKYWHEVSTGRVSVLPILIEDCRVPPLLKTKKYADFRSGYKVGLVHLATSLQPYHSLSGIMHYYSDIVDVSDDWQRLFTHSDRLDLLLMYGGTWRYTYFKELRALVEKPAGRLRVVMPQLIDGAPLLKVYSERLGMSPSDVLGRVATAIDELSQLAKVGHVEIYTVPFYFYHACYLFDGGGVLALYSYKSYRVSTPAFILNDGELMRYLRSDFEWLVSDANSTRLTIYKPR